MTAYRCRLIREPCIIKLQQNHLSFSNLISTYSQALNPVVQQKKSDSRTLVSIAVKLNLYLNTGSFKLCFTYHNVLKIKMTKDDSKLIPITMLITPTLNKI